MYPGVTFVRAYVSWTSVMPLVSHENAQEVAGATGVSMQPWNANRDHPSV